MADEVEIPSEFGASWVAFCQHWTCDCAIAYSPTEVSRGLSTLKRLWSEEVARIVQGVERGHAATVSAIATGLLFEGSGAFDKVGCGGPQLP
jgi:hypothetical protein